MKMPLRSSKSLLLCSGLMAWLSVLVSVPLSAEPQAPEQGSDQSNPKIEYEKQVKTLLRERCFACHGPLRQEASLRLDTLESILAGGDSGPAIVPN